jgi:hypothetical protein
MQLVCMQHPLDDKQDAQIFEAVVDENFELPTESVEQTRIVERRCVAHALLCPPDVGPQRRRFRFSPQCPEIPKCKDVL